LPDYDGYYSTVANDIAQDRLLPLISARMISVAGFFENRVADRAAGLASDE
jgi:hypothetical protein